MKLEYKLDKDGRALLKVKIKPFNKFILQPYVYKIDTGADWSAISRTTLSAMGYTLEWIRSNSIPAKGFTTADGQAMDAAFVRLSVVSLEGIEFRNWPFLVMFDSVCECGKISIKDLRNLIGNDILDLFKAERDPIDRVIRMELLHPITLRRKLFENQEVNVDKVKHRLSESSTFPSIKNSPMVSLKSDSSTEKQWICLSRSQQMSVSTGRVFL